MFEIIFGIVAIIISFVLMLAKGEKISKLIYQFEGIYLLVLFLLFILGVVMLLDGVVAS